MTLMTNRPVKGDQFFGRKALLENLKSRIHRPTWILGNRRAGKTSLLKHIEWLCQKSAWGNVRALFWDFQGAGSMEGLKDSLLESLEDNMMFTEACQIDIDELETLSLSEVLTKLRRKLRNQAHILLLIDEVEELVDITQKEPQVSGALRKVHQGNITLMMTGSSRFLELNESKSLTSPLLPDFLPPVFLTPFELEETQEMLSRFGITREQAAEIHHYSLGNPHLTNHIAERLEEHGQIRRAVQQVIDDKVATYFFQSNFACLPKPYPTWWDSDQLLHNLEGVKPYHKDFLYFQQSAICNQKDLSPLLREILDMKQPSAINLTLANPQEESDLSNIKKLSEILSQSERQPLTLPDALERGETIRDYEAPPHPTVLYSAGEPAENILQILQRATPEYVRGESFNKHTEVYLLALCIYRSRSQQPLFPHTDVWEFAESLAEQAPEPSTFIHMKDFNPNLGIVMSKALHPEPTQRHKDLNQFISDLESVC